MNLVFNEAGSKLLGEMLKKLRKHYGHSQAVVADHIGIDRSTYSKYELGRTPDVETIAKLAAFYGVSANSLLSPFFENFNSLLFPKARSPTLEFPQALRLPQLRPSL